MTYTLTGFAQTLSLPSYNVWTGTVSLPANAGGTLTIQDSQNNFNSSPTSTGGDAAYAARTKDLYTSATFGSAQTFAAGTVTVTLTSPCITSGTTYYLDGFGVGQFQGVQSGVASGTSVTIAVPVSGGSFPANVTLEVILSH